MSSSRVQTILTGAPAALATCTASLTKSEVGVGAPAEAAAEEHGVDLDLLGLEPGDLRRDLLVQGLELRAGPDLALVRGRSAPCS